MEALGKVHKQACNGRTHRAKSYSIIVPVGHKSRGILGNLTAHDGVSAPCWCMWRATEMTQRWRNSWWMDFHCELAFFKQIGWNLSLEKKKISQKVGRRQEMNDRLIDSIFGKGVVVIGEIMAVNAWAWMICKVKEIVLTILIVRKD